MNASATAATAATAAAVAITTAAAAASACFATNTAAPPTLSDAVRAMVAAGHLKESADETFHKLQQAVLYASDCAPIPTSTTVNEEIYDLTGRVAGTCELARYEAHLANLAAESRRGGMLEGVLRHRVRQVRRNYYNCDMSPLRHNG